MYSVLSLVFDVCCCCCEGGVDEGRAGRSPSFIEARASFLFLSNNSMIEDLTPAPTEFPSNERTCKMRLVFKEEQNENAP